MRLCVYQNQQFLMFKILQMKNVEYKIKIPIKIENPKEKLERIKIENVINFIAFCSLSYDGMGCKKWT